MKIKKTGRVTIGADLSKNESKALEIEVKKAMAEYDWNNADEIDAIVLWVLHTQFGFGYKRLKRFYDNFNPMLDSLCKRYEMQDKGDDVWLATHLLKERLGIDIHEWNAEARENSSAK